MKLFCGSADFSGSTPNLEAYARLSEMLRQERERIAALTDAERAREEAERERDTRDLAAELWRSSNGFMQVLLAAQEAAKEAR